MTATSGAAGHDDGVVDADPTWPAQFQRVRAALTAALADLAVVFEHVGSTAVTGLAAKPVIDVDVVVDEPHLLAPLVQALDAAGWTARGDLGIPGREAFEARVDLPFHHLYVVVAGSRPHLDHVEFRDHLRAHPEAAREYAALKRGHAHLLATDRPAYQEAKREFVEGLLAQIRGVASVAGDEDHQCAVRGTG